MRTITRTGALLAGAALTAALLSACGASGTTTSTTVPVAATGGGTGNAARAAYETCLEQHGVTLPSHSPGQAKPSAGTGANPQDSAAASACASLRPAGGNGGANRGGGTAQAAFRTCMAQQGAAIPTAKPSSAPSAAASGDARYLNGLNPSDPKVAAALAACKALLPSHSPKASSSPAA